MRGHIQSYDKDGCHTNRSAVLVTENPMLHTNCAALCFIEAKLWPIEALHCGNMDLGSFLLRWPWPWPDDPSYTNLTCIPCRYTGCANISFVRQGFRKLSSDRQTDRHKRNYIPHGPHRFAGGQLGQSDLVHWVYYSCHASSASQHMVCLFPN